MPYEGRAQDKKKFWYSLPRKKVSFSYGNLRLFQIINLKKRSFDQVKELFKVNQICIPDYQYYFGCNAKRMVHLTFLEKKFVFQSEISTYSFILFSKIQKFHRVRELFKSNQTRYGVCPMKVEHRTKRNFGIACLGKKLVFHTEICEFREQ